MLLHGDVECASLGASVGLPDDMTVIMTDEGHQSVAYVSGSDAHLVYIGFKCTPSFNL